MSSGRKHTSEQKMQKSRRSGEDKSDQKQKSGEDNIKVTLRRDKVEVVGTPSQVGRFFQAARGVQRTATGSSGGSRPPLPHKSQEHGTSLVRSDREYRSSQTGSRRIQHRTSEVVQHVHSATAVRSTCKTSSSTYHSLTTQATYASRSNVKGKDGATKNARQRQSCVAVVAIKMRSG